ncbi:hypothetical protein PG988_002511 [Apiospora saccharicola]
MVGGVGGVSGISRISRVIFPLDSQVQGLGGLGNVCVSSFRPKSFSDRGGGKGDGIGAQEEGRNQHLHLDHDE